jgi:hypothetical protein
MIGGIAVIVEQPPVNRLLGAGAVVGIPGAAASAGRVKEA